MRRRASSAVDRVLEEVVLGLVPSVDRAGGEARARRAIRDPVARSSPTRETMAATASMSASSTGSSVCDRTTGASPATSRSEGSSYGRANERRMARKRRAPVEAPASGTAVQENPPDGRERVEHLGPTPPAACPRSGAPIRVIHSVDIGEHHLFELVDAPGGRQQIERDDRLRRRRRELREEMVQHQRNAAIDEHTRSRCRGARSADHERGRSKPRRRARPHSRTARTGRRWSSPPGNATALMPSRSIPTASISCIPASRINASLSCEDSDRRRGANPRVGTRDRRDLACGQSLP